MGGNFFTKNYKKCWKFFCESRWFFVLAFGVFGIIFLIGFAYPVFFREEIFKFLAGMIDALEGKSIVELIIYIFLNNLKAGFVAIVSGIVVGILPLAVVIVNGYLVGFVAKEAVMQEGIFVLWTLVPHGIFELPAFIFSVGIGMKIGVSFFEKNYKKRLRCNFVEGLRFFVFVILPLLLVAGIIEGLFIGIFA